MSDTSETEEKNEREWVLYDREPIPYFHPTLLFTESEVEQVDWEKVFTNW